MKHRNPWNGCRAGGNNIQHPCFGLGWEGLLSNHPKTESVEMLISELQLVEPATTSDYHLPFHFCRSGK